MKYRVKYIPQHPNASASGCVPVHVLVAEQALGRYLPAGAHVHHVNGDETDNRPANLVICQDAAYHKLLHMRARIVSLGGNPNTDYYCSTCQRSRPKSAFYRRASHKGAGVLARCKECRRWLRGRPS